MPFVTSQMAALETRIRIFSPFSGSGRPQTHIIVSHIDQDNFCPTLSGAQLQWPLARPHLPGDEELATQASPSWTGWEGLQTRILWGRPAREKSAQVRVRGSIWIPELLPWGFKLDMRTRLTLARKMGRERMCLPFCLGQISQRLLFLFGDG